MLCPNCGLDNIPGIELCESCGTDLAGLDIPEAGGGDAGRLLTDRLRTVPMAPPLWLGPEATVREAVELMREKREGFVLVVKDGSLVGIFTEHDVVSRVLRRDLDPGNTGLSAVMTRRPITLTRDDPPAWAIHRMVSQKLRHIPILDGDEAAGLISIRGILRYLASDLIAG